MEARKPNILTVFDFDHTLVDGNTDTWVTKLYEPAMTLIREKQRTGLCWTNVMDQVFELLHDNNFIKQDYQNCFETLKFLEGMKETCEFIHKNDLTSIIISDSNTYFIDHLLERDNLGEVFLQVFTNPAEWAENSCLHVEAYHSHDCHICPENLCKQQVLSMFLAEQRKMGNSFDHIIYIGDGKGDVCPGLSLKHTDYIMAREGYPLLDLLRKESSQSGVSAQIVPWTSGFQILKLIQELQVNFKK